MQSASPLEGVAKEWEESEEIRAHMREHRCLLRKELWDEHVKIDVRHAEMNFPVLRVLVRRLRDEGGNVSMLTIPHIISENPGGTKKCSLCVLFLFSYVCACFFSGILVGVRMMKLYTLMSLSLPSKKDIKQEAKTMKKFLVLVKRKLQRQQLCRSYLFRRLLSMVFDPDEKDTFVEKHLILVWFNPIGFNLYGPHGLTFFYFIFQMSLQEPVCEDIEETGEDLEESEVEIEEEEEEENEDPETQEAADTQEDSEDKVELAEVEEETKVRPVSPDSQPLFDYEDSQVLESQLSETVPSQNALVEDEVIEIDETPSPEPLCDEKIPEKNASEEEETKQEKGWKEARIDALKEQIAKLKKAWTAKCLGFQYASCILFLRFCVSLHPVGGNVVCFKI